MTPAYLTREPALNRKLAITANRLLIHATTTEEAVVTLLELIPHWPQTHAVLLSFVRLVPSESLLATPLPENSFFEIPLAALSHPVAHELIACARQKNLPLCLSWHDGLSPFPTDAGWRFTLVDWRKSKRPGNSPGIVLAWGVPDPESARAALHAGFAGFCGWEFLRRLPPPRDEPKPARATILQIMALLQRDADIGEIEQLFKRDVALGYRLLKYLNSAAMGLRVEITSFRHAVNILGYHPLFRWLSLLLLHAHDHPAMPALAQTALTRARYLELLASDTFGPEAAEPLFLTGLFSILPQLTGKPAEEALADVVLPEPVAEAILRRAGPYAPLLDLAAASENTAPTSLLAAAETLGIGPARHNIALLTALEFADQLNQL
ncbi:MAG: HDOD domain-containing protein [Hydrogenophilus sp.]|nr:HDOD domain-containing protein [Hydrogenophilus sp.]